MSKSWNRQETWLALVVLAVGLLIVGVLGIWGYMSATSAPLHPAAREVPSMSGPAPAREWAAAAEEARQAARTALAEQNLPGLSVAVGAGGRIVWAEGFGWADMDRREPVAPDTQFRIGTASTVLTSAAVGLLLEQGRLSLDDEVQNDVPRFPRKEWPVTLRQLMGHTAGIRSDGGDEGPLLSQHCERPSDALRHFADRDLLFEPGTEYRYSRYGWIVVSAAVEAAAKELFARFMRKRVFEPLGMNDTADDSASGTSRAQATSYFPRFAADPRYGPDPMRPIDLSCYAGSSVFVSTPSDLVRFGMAMANGALVKPATLDLLQAAQSLPSGEDTGYGLGWDLEDATLAGEPVRVVGHDGDLLGGMVASLMTFPDRGLVVAVLSNISYADTFGIGLRVADAFAEDAPGNAARTTAAGPTRR